MNIENKFWSKVSVKGNSECWEWKSQQNDNGYGRINYQGKYLKAHRVAWFLSIGNIPVGMCVLHKCDNRLCCNPDHLFLGTNADNVADKVSKGRQHINRPVGESCGRPKLTQQDVREIRCGHALGVTEKALSLKYGVSQQHINRIVKRLNWKHI